MKANNKYKTMVFGIIGFLLLFAPLAAHADFSFSMGDNGYYPDSNKHTNISKVELFVYNSPGDIHGFRSDQPFVQQFRCKRLERDLGQSHLCAVGWEEERERHLLDGPFQRDRPGDLSF